MGALQRSADAAFTFQYLLVYRRSTVTVRCSFVEEIEM